jgi:hypothetical protein
MSLLKKVAVPALLILSLAQSGVLLKQALDDKALGESRYSEVSQENPVCLAEKGSPSAFIVMESDDESKVYRGLRILVMFPIPFEQSFRDLNSRKDLIRVDCRDGKPMDN